MNALENINVNVLQHLTIIIISLSSLYGPLCHLYPYFCILLRYVCVADTKTDCQNSSLSTPLARLGRGLESSHRPRGDALEVSREELRMQDEVCSLQAWLLGWVEERD